MVVRQEDELIESADKCVYNYSGMLSNLTKLQLKYF